MIISFQIINHFSLEILGMQIPNGLGSLSGLVQLILYGTFYRTTNWDDNEEKPKPEVELP